MNQEQTLFTLRVPVTTTVSSACARYLIQLAQLDNMRIEEHNDTKEEEGEHSFSISIYDHIKEKYIATRLIEIINWLSLIMLKRKKKNKKNDQLYNPLLSLLGGDNMLDRRKVNRGIKRVLDWEKDWNDYDTLPDKQMSYALNKKILFDKLIRRKNIKHIVNSTVQERSIGNGVLLSVADVVLCAIIYPWLVAFPTYQNYLMMTIPCVIRYIQNIMKEIMEMNICTLNVEPYFLTYLRDHFQENMICPTKSWVMNVNVVDQTNKPFRFKDINMKKKNIVCYSNDDNEQIEDVTGRDTTPGEAVLCDKANDIDLPNNFRNNKEFDDVVDRLIAMIDWTGRDSVMSTLSPPEHELRCDDEVVEDARTEMTRADMSSLAISPPPTESIIQTPSSSSLPLINQTDCLANEGKRETFWTHLQLPPKRRDRKRKQIESLLTHASELLPHGGSAVEFCCGGGYVGIALATIRPDARILLTDMNSVSLAFAKERIEKLKLTNVFIVRCQLSDWEESLVTMPSSFLHYTTEVKCSTRNYKFDLGLALHACGPATDSVQRICAKARANFVLSPCCYGFIQHAAKHLHSSTIQQEMRGPDRFDSDNTNESIYQNEMKSIPRYIYPLSSCFREAGWEATWYPHLCKMADHTFWSHDQRSTTFNSAGQRAMRLIDTDRLMHFQEVEGGGYSVSAHYMKPLDASPKNHILVGQLTT